MLMQIISNSFEDQVALDAFIENQINEKMKDQSDKQKEEEIKIVDASHDDDTEMEVFDSNKDQKTSETLTFNSEEQKADGKMQINLGKTNYSENKKMEVED